MQGVRHTRCREIPPSAGGLGTWSFPGAQHILHVFGDSDAGGETGTMREPFKTIGAAVAAANGLAPAVDNRVLLLVWPKEGGYDEAVTLADDYVYLAGVSRDACILTNNAAVVLTITADHVAVWNMTIAATGAPHIVSISGSSAAHFQECTFTKTDAASRFVLVATSSVTAQDCVFSSLTVLTQYIIEVQNSAGNILTLRGCRVSGFTTISGVSSFTVQDTELLEIDFFSTGTLTAENCVIDPRAVAFHGIRVQVGSVLVIVGCRFAVGGGLYSIYAGAAVTGAIIENNTMVGGLGISSYVSHLNPVKRVGAAAVKDWYPTVQAALTACTYDDCVVEMYQDETLAAILGPPAGRAVTIDGRGVHTLSAATIYALGFVGANTTVTMRDVSVTVGSLVLNVAGCILVLERCVVNSGVLVSGGDASCLLHIKDSRVFGNGTWVYAIGIALATPTIIVERSFLKGLAGSPAVHWGSGVTNNNLKMKHSTIVHGSAAGNNPFGANAAQTPNFRAHHCGFNADPTSFAGPPTWTNLVAAGQEQNTYDVNVDWS